MTGRGRPSWSRVGATTVVWIAVWAVTMGLLLQRIVIVRDEAWMLWLATRVARGDVLYRDAYDVTTPVAAWIGAAAVRVTGAEMATLRGVQAAVFAAQVLLGLSVVRRCAVRTLGQGVFVLVLLTVAAPFVAFVSLYSGLAICFALGALRATLWWLDTVGDADGEARADAAAWAVGLTGGLAFWTKPNVGALVALAVAAAVVAAMWGTPIRRWWPALARMAAGAGAVSAICAIVIVATGAGPAFVDQVFRSKGEYLDVGFGYLPALGKRYERLVSGAVPFQIRQVTRLVMQAAPVVVLGAVAVGARRARTSPRAPLVALVAFAVAGLLGVLPRPGLNHITGVLPLVVTALVATWAVGTRRAPLVSESVSESVSVPVPTGSQRGRGSLGTLAVAGVGVLALIGLVAAAVPLLRPANPDRLHRDAAHFVGTPVTDRQFRSSARLARQLRARGIDTVFLVRKDAGFLYLRTGTRNPLPFDIVERSDLGGDDEAGVIQRLAAGEAEWVCVRKRGSGGRSDTGLVPVRLERWIRTHFQWEADLARCELYRVTDRRNVRGPRSRGALASRGATPAWRRRP